MEHKLLMEIEDKIREEIRKINPKIKIDILSAGKKDDMEILRFIIHQLNGKCYSSNISIHDSLDHTNQIRKKETIDIFVYEIKHFIMGR